MVFYDRYVSFGNARVRPQQCGHQWLANREHPGTPGPSQQHANRARFSRHRGCEHGALLRGKKGNTHPRRGTWSPPFGNARAKDGRATGWRHLSVCHENEDLQFLRTEAFYRCRFAVTPKMSPRTTFHAIEPEGPMTSTVFSSGLHGSRGRVHEVRGLTKLTKTGSFQRQVTTATPATLDFRRNGFPDEGCADAMSTDSL